MNGLAQHYLTLGEFLPNLKALLGFVTQGAAANNSNAVLIGAERESPARQSAGRTDPVIPWEKRCYMLNTKHIELRDDDMDIVSPNRPHNILALYQMINLRLALVLKRPNSCSVLAIA